MASASSEATFTNVTPPEAVSASVVAVEEKKRDLEVAHKTKIIQFLGRTTPIILQNDNGPCPLLAICNVLLLKNQLNVSSDIPEISQEKLLSLVAERLLDSNSNINNQDAGYAENQQQNIADAIDLLPRLATGIDVNIKFTRIDDFEFTRECAIFDLLDIPLYHGWIVDPQDHDTATVIGSKSYNTLVEELVALDARDTETGSMEKSEEECVDFAAATTATLGVPSPCFSRGRSFDDSPVIDPNSPKLKKGDITEESELQRVLNLSVSEVSTSSKNNAVCESEPVSPVETLEQNGGSERQNHCSQESSTSDNSIDLIDHNIEGKGAETILQGGVSSSGGTEQGAPLVQTSSGEPSDHVIVQETRVDALVNKASVSRESGLSAGEDEKHTAENYGDDQKQVAPTPEIVSSENVPVQCGTLENSNLLVMASDTDSSTTRSHSTCETEGIVPSVVESEPMYEGEESIIVSETIVNQSREPMYEGEVILAEQCVTGFKEAACDGKKEELTPEEGVLIRNFLRNSASQLTIYGLFRLRDDLKERELCVFFRNNHFNTMFKFEGDLYILATDQGFMNQPGLVWEKLNEVNGDTVYMTCDFKEFNGEDHNNTAWDEQIARASTAEFLANSAEDANYDADLKLARDLQQQEFDQNPPPQQHQNPPQHQSAADGSRFTVGPQGSTRSSGSRPVGHHSSRQETKSAKDKCTIM